MESAPLGEPVDAASGADDRGRQPPHPLLTRWYSSEGERQRRVRNWFDHSAASYDWITQTMSFGSGRWYRRRVLRRAGLGPGWRVLDVACGTGVLAEAASALTGSPERVVALDPSAGMLAQARRREVGRLVQATAEMLPFADGSFDCVLMGYALRHVADLRQTFAQYRRVLRPGGRLVVLEITRPGSRAAAIALRLYLRGAVPALARLGGRPVRELMQYYWDTIEACVEPAAILQALSASGFAARRGVELGIFSEYVAEAA